MNVHKSTNSKVAHAKHISKSKILKEQAEQSSHKKVKLFLKKNTRPNKI